MTDFYSQNRCVCSTRSHGPLLCAFWLSLIARVQIMRIVKCEVVSMRAGYTSTYYARLNTMRFLSFVGPRDNERRKIAQCERAADNCLSLTRQRDSCWTDSKIDSVQLLLNESQRSFDKRRSVSE